MTSDLSTLICLFHSRDHAHAALEDLLRAGIPEANITLIGDEGSNITASKSTLAELNVPQRDLDHLLAGMEDGGAVLSVSAISDDADKVEAIFRDHSAEQIDEETVADDMSHAALPLAAVGAGSGRQLEEDSVTDTPVLVTEELAAAETPEGMRIFRVLTVEPLTESTAVAADGTAVEQAAERDAAFDRDPRELGLDARLMPEPNHQVQ